MKLISSEFGWFLLVSSISGDVLSIFSIITYLEEFSNNIAHRALRVIIRLSNDRYWLERDKNKQFKAKNNEKYRKVQTFRSLLCYVFADCLRKPHSFILLGDWTIVLVIFLKKNWSKFTAFHIRAWKVAETGRDAGKTDRVDHLQAAEFPRMWIERIAGNSLGFFNNTLSYLPIQNMRLRRRWKPDWTRTGSQKWQHTCRNESGSGRYETEHDRSQRSWPERRNSRNVLILHWTCRILTWVFMWRSSFHLFLHCSFDNSMMHKELTKLSIVADSMWAVVGCTRPA